ncbi:MAG: hypothetical protein LBG78_02665 [Azoarcus sp.]|jgi:hypothetical protein|nr:hypothetical protein [Azoarcus sp.]
MDRQQLEHIIRAAAGITNQYEFVIIGSQSILGEYPNAPEELRQSMEADVYPLASPVLADLIDGSIGECSPFHETFGYYAQGVGEETAVLPEGWKERLVKVQNTNTDMKIGYCLEAHDLAASKLAAGREKDFQFVKAMLENNLANIQVLKTRIETLPISETQQKRIKSWITAQA